MRSVLKEIFPVEKPLIGNIHCLALPGAPFYERGGMKKAIQHACDEALRMQEAGLDGVIIENAGDFPYLHPDDVGPDTVAAMTEIVNEVAHRIDIPYGVLVLGNAAIPSIAVAAATGASFVRVNLWAHAYVGIEGLMNGPAAEALRFRSNIKAEDVKVLADVHVKFGAHTISSDRPIHELAKDVENFGAQVLVATGQRTGDPTPVSEVIRIKKGTDLEVIVGSGLNPDNARDLFEEAAGAIVGAYLKEDGRWQNTVSVKRAKKLVEVVKEIRAANI